MPAERKAMVSIPKRVHRPFSHYPLGNRARNLSSFNPQTGSSAFQPYTELATTYASLGVSIPKRVHRPFSLVYASIQGDTGCRFNPQTGSSAFQPTRVLNHDHELG